MGSFSALALAASVVLLPSPVVDGGLDDQLRRPGGSVLSSSTSAWDGGNLEVGVVAEPPPPEPEPEPMPEPTDFGAAGRAVAASGDNISMLTRLAGMGAPLQGITNGSMPSGLLCPIPWSPSFSLYCPAIEPLSALNEQYRQTFGSNLQFASAYRAGFQGRSFHGWGIAIDIAGSSGTLRFDEPQYQWLMQNAPSYGWYHPFWAGRGGDNPEAWHWELGSYYRGTSADFDSAMTPVPIHWVKY